MITEDAVTAYKAMRDENDRDLVSEVRTILHETGLQIPTAKYFDTHPIIQDAQHKKPDVQRWLLNRYWNLQLMACNVPSVNVRFCLIPNGPIDEWINLFKTMVVPFLVRHTLPMDITSAHHG